MNDPFTLAIINLVGRVGFDGAIYFLQNIKNAKTIDDAIAALDASAKKTWDDYKKEALNALTVPPAAPPTP